MRSAGTRPVTHRTATFGNPVCLLLFRAAREASHRYEQLPLAFEPIAPESAGNAKFLARDKATLYF